MSTALVTGATSGLGLSFARRLAADGHDLVVVARGAERLERVAAELRSTYGRDVRTVAADLTDRAQLQRVADRLVDDGHPVDLLVNNAGFALGRGFTGSEIGDEERLLDIHCRAVLVLSHAAARVMRGRRRGTILNVSSVAGFATLGTYSAAKAWTTAFSESLAVELGPHGVQVTAVCPGFVHTEFHGRADIDMSAMPAVGWLEADDVIDAALADVARGRVVSVPSKRFKAVAFGCRHLPRAVVRAVSGRLQDRRGQR